MNTIDLAGRGAVVSGGAQGIGYAIAERLPVSGAAVEPWHRDAGLLDEAQASLSGKGTVSARAVYVTDAAGIAEAARAAAGRCPTSTSSSRAPESRARRRRPACIRSSVNRRPLVPP